MKEAFRTTLIYGSVISVLTIVFATHITAAFGFGSDASGMSAVFGVRALGLVMTASAVLKLFFVYYFLTGMRIPMYILTLLQDLVNPIALGVLGGVIFNREEGIWIGMAASQVVTLIICSIGVRLIYGKERFPLLMTVRGESRIYIYDFNLSAANNVAMSRTAGRILKSEGYPNETVKKFEFITEEVLMLIMEKTHLPWIIFSQSAPSSWRTTVPD